MFKLYLKSKHTEKTQTDRQTYGQIDLYKALAQRADALKKKKIKLKNKIKKKVDMATPSIFPFPLFGQSMRFYFSNCCPDVKRSNT